MIRVIVFSKLLICTLFVDRHDSGQYLNPHRLLTHQRWPLAAPHRQNPYLVGVESEWLARTILGCVLPKLPQNTQLPHHPLPTKVAYHIRLASSRFRCHANELHAHSHPQLLNRAPKPEHPITHEQTTNNWLANPISASCLTLHSA